MLMIFFADAPIVGTLPHFLNADEKYGLMVDGLEPKEEKHNIFLDVEPRTGAPLNGGKRLQFNMFLKKIDRISEIWKKNLLKFQLTFNLFSALTDNFKNPRLFPVLWVEESIELNDELVGMIKSDLINVLLLVDILQWTFVGIGALLIVGMLIWFFIARRKRVTKTTSVDPMISVKD
jgi:lysosome membrane protein 2